jgi:uncharacterized protein YbjT (DUF2867 family)
VAGATGLAGSAIVESLQRRGVRVRAMVRRGTSRKDAVKALVDGGADIVEGDVLDPLDGLAGMLEGADVIISAVQGGPEVVTDGQINLLRAAEKAGVPRMIPSDFAIDLFRLELWGQCLSRPPQEGR